MLNEATREAQESIENLVPTGTLTAERDELTLRVTGDELLATMQTLHDNGETQFVFLADVTATDNPGRAERFDVVYHLLSVRQNVRLRVKVATNEDTPVPSVADIWQAAIWFERETWDMYGIFFTGHPDLRRILTDYGFDGHPLRKDFPLTGHVEVRYDNEAGRVIYEPVQLQQEMRSFDYASPWEGMTRQLPGDEKATTEGEGA